MPQKLSQSSAHLLDQSWENPEVWVDFRLNHEKFHMSPFTKVGAGCMIYNFYFWSFQTLVQLFGVWYSQTSLDWMAGRARRQNALSHSSPRAEPPAAFCPGVRAARLPKPLGPADAVRGATSAAQNRPEPTVSLLSCPRNPSTRGECSHPCYVRDCHAPWTSHASCLSCCPSQFCLNL
jgi:hypothetical protein